MAQDLVQFFYDAPPVTRTLVAATFIESALCLSGILNFQLIVFHAPWVFTFPPQLWRLVTPFLITGSGFSFPMDLFFLWTYGSGLEVNSARFAQPGSFFVYVAFLFLTIMSIGGLLLHSYIFTSALLIALIYTFAQDNRGKKAHFIIVQIPVEYLPLAMLTMTFVMGGWPLALQQGTGVFAAHLYDFLTRIYPTFQGGTNFIRTPQAVQRFFGGTQRNVQNKAFGTAFTPARPNPEPQSRGWSSALGGSWGGRGAGRRLGGE